MQTSAGMAAGGETRAEQGQERPPELDAWLNRHLYHPLARRLARAAVGTPVSPNALSVAGGALVAAAAILYTELSWPLSVLLGFAAHALWHVLDGADGMLARMTGTASPTGELVDGAADYLSHLFLYTWLGFWLADRIGWWGYALGLAAGLSRIVQANHAETQRRIYLWRVCRVPWLRQAQAGGDSLFRDRGLFARLAAPAARGYVAMAGALNALSAEVDTAMDRHQDRARAVALCRAASRGPLRMQAWLGANPRTVALGLSMALGTPLWFFLFEATLLNLLLVVSVMRQRASDRRLAAELAAG